MAPRRFLRTYSGTVSLVLLPLVWASLGWETLRAIPSDGLGAVDSLSAAGPPLMFVITLATTVYVARREAAGESI